MESLVEELTKFAHETVDALREAGSANWMANIALMTRLRRAIIARHSPSDALKEALEALEKIAADDHDEFGFQGPYSKIARTALAKLRGRG